MAKLKINRVHKAICPVCKGNGFVKIMKEDKEPHVHQCWECESEGEFYVHESEISEHDVIDNDDRTINKLLH